MPFKHSPHSPPVLLTLLNLPLLAQAQPGKWPVATHLSLTWLCGFLSCSFFVPFLSPLVILCFPFSQFLALANLKVLPRFICPAIDSLLINKKPIGDKDLQRLDHRFTILGPRLIRSLGTNLHQSCYHLHYQRPHGASTLPLTSLTPPTDLASALAPAFFAQTILMASETVVFLPFCLL